MLVVVVCTGETQTQSDDHLPVECTTIGAAMEINLRMTWTDSDAVNVVGVASAVNVLLILLVGGMGMVEHQ
jgi:hypothetical protein